MRFSLVRVGPLWNFLFIFIIVWYSAARRLKRNDQYSKTFTLNLTERRNHYTFAHVGSNAYRTKWDAISNFPETPSNYRELCLMERQNLGKRILIPWQNKTVSLGDTVISLHTPAPT